MNVRKLIINTKLQREVIINRTMAIKIKQH